VVDDQLTVLPISSHNLQVEPVVKFEPPPNEEELENLKESLRDTQPVGVLVNCCKTVDQVSKFYYKLIFQGLGLALIM
jgi:N-acetyltransferase 10